MYTVQIKRSALKELAQISPPYKESIIAAIDALEQNPRPPGCKQLKGINAYRIRVADYRVVYTIEDAVQIVEVQRVRHRRDAYR
jgi:mRNA interferase RelE/StbE